MTHDLLVIGGSLAGLSAAAQARRSGVEDVLVLGLDGNYRGDGFIEMGGLDIAESQTVDRVVGNGAVIEIHAGDERFTAHNVLLDVADRDKTDAYPWKIPDKVTHRVHKSLDFDAKDNDVLVVGNGEPAVDRAARLVEANARVVLANDGESSGISLFSRQLLERFERDQLATVLWHSALTAIADSQGYPMAIFDDRRTPDLQFDHIVVAMPAERFSSPFDVEVDDSLRGGLFVLGEGDVDGAPGVPVAPSNSWSVIQESRFPHLEVVSGHAVIDLTHEERRELASTHYNATITAFDTAHNELWRMRLKPDRETIAHRAGQYCSIGLGYWEPRADDATDDGLDKKMRKLIRRSYSISSPIFETSGYLTDDTATDEIELYIVWVQPDEERVPALTPRLALKNVGDRLYLGPKVAGRYTVSSVTDPDTPIVFVATGTGEAPHNAMAVELLRKGHRGPILSIVSVRYWSDLAYVTEHRRLEEQYPNYTYLPAATREKDVPKRYAQDLLQDGTIEEALGTTLDPDWAHVFMCGNPDMIGLPEWEDDGPVFPEIEGMSELLTQRGFTLDRRGHPGNVHYEEYW